MSLKSWLFAIISLLILGGCGFAIPSDTPLTTGASNEAITLRVATGDSGSGLTPHEEIIAAFEAENPNITVELESVQGRDYYGRLLTYIAADEAPDIMQIGDDGLPKFVAQGALVPLDGYMATSGLNEDMYLTGLLSPGQWRGQQYLLPKDYSPLGVYYNKQIFDEQGVPYPQADWTWDDFLATAQQLTIDEDGDGRTDIYGVQLPAAWTSGFEYWVAANGGQLVSPDGQRYVSFMDSPQTVEAVQFYADLYNVHQVAPLPDDLNSFGGGNTEFQEGHAAMQIFGRWPQASLLDNPDIDLGVASLPKKEQAANVLFWGGLGISSNSPNKEAAWKLLQFYTGEQGAQVWQNWALPAVDAVADEAGLMDDPIEGVWLEALDNVQPRAYTFNAAWESTGDPALRRVLETAIIDPDANIEALLQEAARQAQEELEASQ